MVDNTAMARVASAAYALTTMLVLVLLLAGGPLQDRAWTSGAHGSPAQWAYHLLLVGAGMHDHHTSQVVDETAPPPSAAATIQGPALAPMAPAGGTTSDAVALLGALGLFTLAAGRWPRRLQLA